MNTETKELIDKEIKNNEVCLFMKGTPDVPQCGFSLAVANVLKHLKVNFKGINILENQEVRQTLPEVSDWPTFPQLFVNGELIGGCDIVSELHGAGDLQSIIDKVSS